MKRRKRILIVDDEASLTRLLKLSLEGAGPYEVRVENESAAAVDAAHEFRPDLILLDVLMPGLDGGEVCHQLERQAGGQKAPVVFLTAAAKKEEIDKRGGMIGGYPFLAKPVDLEELVQCIEKHTPAPRQWGRI